ncbi:hypothetical protein ACFPK1_28205 [Actinomycetospora rhizophila]|uniref:ATP-grasp domain-containing protein n=1 Tax=Actinomycetospora rhizophila TaxID=1416876 RepID=A0ABV9ZKX6_9PSEU
MRDSLDAIGTASTYLSPSAFPRVEFSTGSLVIDEVECWNPEKDLLPCVWWRRLRRAAPSDIRNSPERDLAADETASLIRGVSSVIDCCVDTPNIVARAEEKPYGLHLARKLGFQTPQSLVTNNEDRAREFLRAGRTIAKPLSSGVGLAPYVDLIDDDLLSLVPAAPVLLQHLVEADSDIRIVTVGEYGTAWKRARGADVVDWRATDPAGEEFVRWEGEASREACANAVRLCRAFGLTVSVQDWLKRSEGELVFLEINPQGQWLFLPGAKEVVAPEFAKRLTAHRTPDQGRKDD